MNSKTTADVLNGVSLGLSLIETFYPQYLELTKAGEVSVEEQAAVSAAIDKIRSGEAFKGIAWKLSTE